MDGPNVITKVLIKGRLEGQHQRFEDEILLILKMEEGTIMQGCRWPLKARNVEEIDFPVEIPKGIFSLADS